jgi:hypothetical protein
LERLRGVRAAEQRSAQEVGIWQKYFLCSNQAGTSPHKKWMNFFANYLSWHDSFCLCGKTRNPHWLWLAARTEFRIFSDRQVARLGLNFKRSKARAKGSNDKQETHTTMQALKKISRSEPHKSDGDGAPSLPRRTIALSRGSAKERGMVVFPTRRLCELEASTVQARGLAGHR